MGVDGWIAVFDADQQRQGGGLDQDRVACEWVIPRSILAPRAGVCSNFDPYGRCMHFLDTACSIAG